MPHLKIGMAQGKGARTLEQAEARALQTCEAAGGSVCAVVGAQCVSTGGQPDTWSGSESVLAGPEEESGPTADAPQDEELTREERMQVQQGLAALGFDPGPADGMFGPRTRSAIREWQQAKGLETTGYLTRDEAEVFPASQRCQTAPSRVARTRLVRMTGSARDGRREERGERGRERSVEEVIGNDVGGVDDPGVVGGGMQDGAIQSALTRRGRPPAWRWMSALASSAKIEVGRPQRAVWWSM